MSSQPTGPDPIVQRLEAMERKLDLLTQHIQTLAAKLERDGLPEKLERGENYPLRNMPEPGNMNDNTLHPRRG